MPGTESMACFQGAGKGIREARDELNCSSFGGSDKSDVYKS